MRKTLWVLVVFLISCSNQKNEDAICVFIKSSRLKNERDLNTQLGFNVIRSDSLKDFYYYNRLFADTLVHVYLSADVKGQICMGDLRCKKFNLNDSSKVESKITKNLNVLNSRGSYNSGLKEYYSEDITLKAYVTNNSYLLLRYWVNGTGTLINEIK